MNLKKNELTLCALRLSARWFWWYMRLKLLTITGTGKAITRTPLREHTPPTIFPAIVFGTMSPYLKQTRNIIVRKIPQSHFNYRNKCMQFSNLLIYVHPMCTTFVQKICTIFVNNLSPSPLSESKIGGETNVVENKPVCSYQPVFQPRFNWKILYNLWHVFRIIS